MPIARISAVGEASIAFVAEAEVAGHLQLGEADIHAIEEGEHVAHPHRRVRAIDLDRDLALKQLKAGLTLVRATGGASQPSGCTVIRGAATAVAMSEPGSGSDVASLRCKAEKVDGGYRLSGTKKWISNAPEADRYLVFATVDPDRGPALAQDADTVELHPENRPGFRVKGSPDITAPIEATIKLPNFSYTVFADITGITRKMISAKLKGNQ